MIGSSETNIESEIVYNARGGEEREPTIEIVEIEENVNVLRENDGGRCEVQGLDTLGWLKHPLDRGVIFRAKTLF